MTPVSTLAPVMEAATAAPPESPGAAWNGATTTFRLWSSTATRVDLVLPGRRGVLEAPLAPAGDGWWRAEVPDAGPGTRYGYRVYGPTGPGHRFDPGRVLLDPYTHGAEPDGWGGLLGVVVDESRRCTPRDRPLTAWNDTVVYEAHVAGLSAAHPRVPAALRGTYLGASHPAVLEHLHRVGITAVELLPVAAFVSEPHLRAAGRVNYWGYNPLAFAAPHVGYSAGRTAQAALDEFRRMVEQFHAAGIEVILDVVFNHTGEGDANQPALSLRGIDNAAYYRHGPDPDRYADVTGCGNTLDVRHPATVELIQRSLQWWVLATGVDGFRFDLATTLARAGWDGEFDPDALLPRALAADPDLAGIKLIAEPWDLGTYGAGRFPHGWAEWNDKFRDDVRDYWRGRAGRGALATRMAGSSDLYPDRGTGASLNFITAHDGFTACDLVTYEAKHNELNGEDNRDGAGDNRSWNCGVEGPSEQWTVRRLRARQVRNLLGTLLLSRGVPMLVAGDEGGRTQHGNNNAYAAADPTAWALRWDEFDEDLVEFCAAALRVRRRFPMLRGAAHLSDRDVTWIGSHGSPVEDWQSSAPLAMILHSPDGDLAVLANPTARPAVFALPGRWTVMLTSADDAPTGPVASGAYLLGSHSMAVAAHGGVGLLAGAVHRRARPPARRRDVLRRILPTTVIPAERQPHGTPRKDTMPYTIHVVGYAEVSHRAMDVVFNRLRAAYPHIHGHEAARDRLRLELGLRRPVGLTDAQWREHVQRVRRELELIAQVPVHWDLRSDARHGAAA